VFRVEKAERKRRCVVESPRGVPEKKEDKGKGDRIPDVPGGAPASIAWDVKPSLKKNQTKGKKKRRKSKPATQSRCSNPREHKPEN